MKNGKQIMTVVYIPFANPPVLIFCYHIKHVNIQTNLLLFLILRTTSDLRSISFSVFLTTSSSLSEKNRTTWLENKAGFLKNKGLVSSSGAKHIEENDSVSFCLAKVKFSFLL